MSALNKKAMKKTEIKKLREEKSDLMRANPQYMGLLETAEKMGKLKEAIKAIKSGKLKVKRDIKDYNFQNLAYHATMMEPEKRVTKVMKKEGLKAFVPKEYGAGAKPGIYFFGSVNPKYLFKGKKLGKYYEEVFKKRKLVLPPHEKVVKYATDPKEKLAREERKKGERLRIYDKRVGVVAVDAEKLAKKGIKFAEDPEIRNAYILVNAKTGEPIKKLPPKLLEFVIEADREGAIKKVEPIAKKEARKRVSEMEKNEYYKEILGGEEGKKAWEEIKKKGAMNSLAQKEYEKELRKKLDEHAIKRIVKHEEEKPLTDHEYLQKILQEEERLQKEELMKRKRKKQKK